MTFLSTNISGARLSINGVDYSDEFVDFTVTDDSIVSSSLVTTNGDITLAQVRGGQPINDLTATRFAAGDIVLLDIKQPDGTFNRHPRGHLLVLASVYDPETRTCTISVGCQIAFAVAFEDKLSDLFEKWCNTYGSATRIAKLPDDTELGSDILGNLLRVEGRFLYQDRFGYLQSGHIFGTANGFYTTPTNIPYKFTSTDHETALSITAQTAAYGGGASGMADGRYVTPVRVEYEYQIAVDSNGKPFANDAAYKAAVFICKKKSATGRAGKVLDVTKTIAYKVPWPYAGYLGTSFTYTITTVTESEKKYRGQGNQISTEQTDVIVEREANNDVANVFIFRMANNRAGGSSPRGNERGRIVNRRTKVRYTYGKGGELKRKETKVYVPWAEFLGADGWISKYEIGTTGTTATPVTLRLANCTVETFKYNLGGGAYKHDEQKTEKYDYAAKEKGSSYYTVEYRRSGGNLAKAAQQDRFSNDQAGVNNTANCNCPAGFECVKETPDTDDRTAAYTSGKVTNIVTGPGLSAFGSSVVANTGYEDFPISYKDANHLGDAAFFDAEVKSYSLLRYNISAADKLGFTVQESLRPEFYNWYPSMPYLLYLKNENKVFSMRISGTTWSVSPNEAVNSFESMTLAQNTGFSVSAIATNSQLSYLKPSTDVPTTANNSISNHDASITNTLVQVTNAGSLTLPPSLGSGSPSPSPSPAPSPSPTPAPAPISLGSTNASIVPNHFNATFRVPVKPVFRQLTLTVVNANPPTASATFRVPISINALQISTNYGTITAPLGTPLNFGTITAPTGPNLNKGTITNPTP